jgi:hypothetical protein
MTPYSMLEGSFCKGIAFPLVNNDEVMIIVSARLVSRNPESLIGHQSPHPDVGCFENFVQP